jgi:hypothetical protein
MTAHLGPVKFLHVPKTGGTSIAKALRVDGPHDPAVYRRTHDHDWDDAFRFTFIRNPWDQVMSWYHWDKMFVRTSFEDWVNAGMPATNRFRGNTPINQAGFFQEPGGAELVHFVGRFETLEWDFKFMCEEILGMDVAPELPHLNATPTPISGKARRDYVAYRYANLYTGELWVKVESHFTEFVKRYGYPVRRPDPVVPATYQRRLQQEWRDRCDKLSLAPRQFHGYADRIPLRPIRAGGQLG